MADPLANGPERMRRTLPDLRKKPGRSMSRLRPRRLLSMVVVEGREGQDRTTLGTQGMSLIKLWIMAGGSRGNVCAPEVV